MGASISAAAMLRSTALMPKPDRSAICAKGVPLSRCVISPAIFAPGNTAKFGPVAERYPGLQLILDDLGARVEDLETFIPTSLPSVSSAQQSITDRMDKYISIRMS